MLVMSSFVVLLASVLVLGCAGGRVNRVETAVEAARSAYVDEGDAAAAIHHLDDALRALRGAPREPELVRLRTQILQAKLVLLLESGKVAEARAVRTELQKGGDSQ
jgi:hypothetical protein